MTNREREREERERERKIEREREREERERLAWEVATSHFLLGGRKVTRDKN